MVEIKDPLTHASTIEYGTQYQSAFPTKVTNEVTNAINQSVQTWYDLSTGHPTTFQGPNGTAETSSYVYNDALDRLTAATLPDSGSTAF